MEQVIPPVDKKLLLDELTPDRLMRKANNGANEIYVFTEAEAPNLMRETGRLREITFRDAGGGTGKSTDVDVYDMGNNNFKQLIVWSPEDQAIVGGYRFIHCKYLKIDADGHVKTPTSKLFAYSKQFVKEFIPQTIELGRSFVQPDYQPSNNLRKGMYALDNLWDGLGALITEYPDAHYFFGKVTMYGHYNTFARDLILYFMKTFFPDPDKLVYPHEPLSLFHDESIIAGIFKGENYDENYKILIQTVRKHGENVPPLVNAYMNLSSTMRSFGTAFNAPFGKVEETGILVTIKDIFKEKKERHLV
ncbi:MAG: GNAT family N-acetyltransferase [Bacteroidales bacterium]|nr:GNAT family N-acetyltransferase [Bacteroidales bacterium]